MPRTGIRFKNARRGIKTVNCSYPNESMRDPVIHIQVIKYALCHLLMVQLNHEPRPIAVTDVFVAVLVGKGNLETNTHLDEKHF